jgi:hypothetical protein
MNSTEVKIKNYSLGKMIFLFLLCAIAVGRNIYMMIVKGDEDNFKLFMRGLGLLLFTGFMVDYGYKIYKALKNKKLSS